MGPSAKAPRSLKLQALSQDHLAKDLRRAVPAGDLRPAVEGPSPADTLGVALLRDGLIAPDEMVQALALHARRSGRLTDILLSRDLIRPDELYEALARHWKTEVIHPLADKPDIRLIDRIGGNFCLRNSLLPWRQTGAMTVIATAQPEEFERHRAKLTEVFGPVAMAIAPAQALEQTILAYRGKSLAQAAETRVHPAEIWRGDACLCRFFCWS